MSFFDGISTGHIGYATVHAESATLVLDRLAILMKKDVNAQQYTDIYLKEILAKSLDLIVFMKDFKVNSICEVNFSYEEGIRYDELFSYNTKKKENGEIVGNFEKKRGPGNKIKRKLMFFEE